MNLSPDALRRQLAGLGPVRRWWLAYSGGLDSRVLLQLAIEAGLAEGGAFEAVHVHHGLQPEADAWADHCRAQCRSLGVPCRVERVTVAAAGGEEAAARDARYAVFTELLAEGDALLMAHHGDDQAETLLLRLCRGSGIRGLAAMPARRSLGRGQLVRPLLPWSRAELEAWARDRRLAWIDDPSNADIDYDRNFLRRQVIPALKGRWPGFDRVLGRTAGHCRDADRLLVRLAGIDLERCAGPFGSLACEPLGALDPASRRNLLRHWIERQGAPLPDSVHLERILSEVIGARDGAEPLVAWGGVEVRRYRGHLYLKRAWPEPEALSLPWNLSQPLALPLGGLAAEPCETGGLRLDPGARVTVGYRRGGERLRLPGRGGSRALKKLLQDTAMPPWLRPWLPLVYVDGELAAVADRWVCEGFLAGPGESGWRILWTPPEVGFEG